MRIFVTGGTGFIGKRLLRRLAADGHEVLALRRSCAGSSAKAVHSTLQFVDCDLLNYEAIRDAINGFQPEVIFHLASARSAADRSNDHVILRTNAEATYQLAKACTILTPRPKFVFASAMGCYNYEHPDYLPVDETHRLSPVDTYGLSKVNAEEACRFFSERHQLPCVILRISGVFGPGKPKGIIYNCLKVAQAGGSIKVAGGKVTRDFIYVDDVIEALLLSMQHPITEGHDVFNIGGGRGASLMDLVRIVEQVTHKTISVEHLPATADSEFYLSNAKAERALGFRPEPLERRIADFWRDFSETDSND